MNTLSKCRVCDSKEVALVCKFKELDYFRCRNCDLVFLNNPPSSKFYKELYSYSASKMTDPERHNPLLNIVMSLPFSSIFLNYMGKGIDQLRASAVCDLSIKKSVLDIGCGGGNFIAGLESLGWKVAGTEMGRHLVEASSTKLKSGKVYMGKVDQINFKANKFGVVTLWHVFEHIFEIGPTLKSISKIIDKSGTLVIEVPHSNSLNFRVFNKHWSLLMPPQHLHFWSKKSFATYLKKFGFRVSNVEYPLHFPFVFSSSLIKVSPLLIIFLPLWIPLSITMTLIMSFLRQGDVIRIYAVLDFDKRKLPMAM